MEVYLHALHFFMAWRLIKHKDKFRVLRIFSHDISYFKLRASKLCKVIQIMKCHVMSCWLYNYMKIQYVYIFCVFLHRCHLCIFPRFCYHLELLSYERYAVKITRVCYTHSHIIKNKLIILFISLL
jgi:hypothetical protein